MKNRLRRFSSSPPVWARRLGKKDVVTASRVSIPRNLAGRNFPHRLTDVAMNDVLEEVRPTLSGCGLKEFNMNEMDERDISLLWERGLFIGTATKEDVRYGKSVFMDDFEKMLVTINELDHFWIVTSLPGMTLRRCLENASTMEHCIAESHKLAFSNESGYMTSFVELHGTGVRLSMTIYIPGITLDWREEFVEWIGELNLEVGGPFGIGIMPENPPLGGSILQVSCNSQNEHETAHNLKVMEGFAEKVTDIEIKCRQNPSSYARDIIGRLWGVLPNRIEANESDVAAGLAVAMLGVWNGMIDEFEIPNIEKMLYLSLYGHLMSIIPDCAEESLDETRASLVKSMVGGSGL